MTDRKKTPQFFIDDDSGEGLQLIGRGDNLSLTAENLSAYLSVAIDQLLEGADGHRVTLTIHRKDMTEEGVAELPEV